MTVTHLAVRFVVTALAIVSNFDLRASAAEAPSLLSESDKTKAIELIKRLGSDEYKVRMMATEELSKMDLIIVPILRDFDGIRERP